MKKVLIITYHWPPAGGPGVQRVLKFAKYLPQFGWQPFVLTVKNGEYPAIDHSLVNEIPADLEVSATKTIEPFSLFKKLTGKKKESKISTYVLSENQQQNCIESFLKWLRINIFLPDAKIGWMPFAVKEAIRLVKNEHIDLILASSPPHTVQLIAAKVARKTGIKWVADFRDPWLEIVYYQNLKRFFLSEMFDRRLERKVLKQADQIICISESIRALFRSKQERDVYHVLANGYDAQDFADVQPEAEAIFTITYTGVLSEERIPYGLIPALQNLKKEKYQFRLRLVGTVCEKFRNLISSAGLNEETQYIGYVQHAESIKFLRRSALLLLVIDDVPENKGFLSGKIFEYLGCRIPILAFGPVDGDAAGILSSTRSGVMLDYHDDSSAYDLLQQLCNRWPESDPAYLFETNMYERKQITARLVKILNSQVP